VDIRTYDKDTYKTISGYTLDRVNFYGVVLYKVNDRAFSSLDQAFRYALSLLTGDEFHENEF
jgi:hypothetical protein